MTTAILNKLSELEKQKNVKVLYACESGSRAWGFPSPDSDFDARFIFIKPKDAYLSIVESDGQIGYPVDDVFDISGWDLQKTLKLIRKCNATPLEWLQSPIIYKEVPDFKEDLWEICQEYFNPKVLLYHYLGIAKGALSKTDKEGNLSVKKFFYVIRPVLSALWIQQYQTIAPMNINKLSTLLPVNLKDLLKELILLKAKTDESMEFKTPFVLESYIKYEMISLELAAKSMNEQHFGYQSLDQFFRKSIDNHDH